MNVTCGFVSQLPTNIYQVKLDKPSGKLVTLSCIPYGTSTCALSNQCSSGALTRLRDGNSHLVVGFVDPACSYSNPSASFRIGRWCARGLPPAFAFTAREGFAPKHSHARSTPWSVLQDGSPSAITPASGQMRVPRSGSGRRRGVITLPEEPRPPRQWAPMPNRCWPGGGRVRRRENAG
jgi:hypothetical protein